MVDLSVNCCIDLQNGRCSSLSPLERSTEFKCKCPFPAFYQDKEEKEKSKREEEEDLEDEDEFYDCEDDDDEEYDDEEDEEDEQNEENGVNNRKNKKRNVSAHWTAHLSASRSPAPERVQDGAQAELNAEFVEISEVIALRYSRLSLAHNPSLLIGPSSPTIGNGTFQQNGGVRGIEVPNVAVQQDESQIMMKRYLIPICTIGEGAFGRVQLCQHRETGRYYALKSMYIPKIVERRQVQHVHQEKRILQALDHPFIVKLWDTAKDAANLFMVMEFLPGGELFSYFRAARKFPSQTVKFYAAEIILALEYLHSIYIAYRDLKPENLMVSLHGHIKLTDFGFAKIIHNKSYTLCGTPSYLAPEVFQRKGHNQSVDWWALGVLIFELMAGDQPFRGKTPEEIEESIVNSKENGLHFPRRTFSPNAKDVIRRLLCIEPKDRIGYSQLKSHQWFCNYDWQELYNRNYKPPFLPTIYHDGDTGNFDSYQEIEQFPPAKQSELDLFDEW
uniref:Uncharacterized protein n=1 Tax=Meloidogyne incognita TaxID=6306 RepID=A0A914KUZ0_MELIC